MLFLCGLQHHLTSTHYLTAVSVSKRTTQGTPPYFPCCKNRMRVHIWRYSVRRECVKHTHSRAHKGPHGAHKPATPPLLQDQSESRSLSDEIRSDPGGVPGLEDVGTHAPVLSVLRLPVTSLVHKVCLSSD